MKDIDPAQLIAALEFYAERKNYYSYPGEGGPVDLDSGNLAKAVLAGWPAYKPEWAKNVR